MEQFYVTPKGIVAGGEEVLPAHVKQTGKRYSKEGWLFDYEARVNGATLTWTLDEAHNNAEAIVKELGPAAAHFKPKNAPLLMEVIARMSDPAYKLETELRPEVFNSSEGLRDKGLLVTDAQVHGVRKVKVKTESGFMPGMAANSVQTQDAYEVTWLHNGLTKRTIVTPSDLTNPSGIVAALGDGAVCHHPMRLACHLGGLIQAAQGAA